MAKKKNKLFNQNLLIFVFLILSVLTIYILGGGKFSTIDSVRETYHQYNGLKLDNSDWENQILKSNTVGFGSLEIIQYKDYYSRDYSDYYCMDVSACSQRTDRTDVESLGFDENGCEHWINDDYFYGNTPRSGDWTRQTGYVNVENNIRCNAGRPDTTLIYACRNGYQEFAGWYDVLSVRGDKTCGGITRDRLTDNIRGCSHKFDVKNNGQLLYSEPDYVRDRETIQIPLNPSGELVRKTLNSYSEIDGYIDCPYYSGETIISCSNLYGSHEGSRDFLVEKSEIIDVTNNKPIPYLVGLWARNENDRRITGNEKWIIAYFNEYNKDEYSSCIRINNDYVYSIPDDFIDINISSPKEFYYEGENGSVDINLYNKNLEDVRLRLDINYAIPTAFGDKEKNEQKIHDLVVGDNNFKYEIPTEQVIEMVKVGVKGDIVVDGNYFSGLNNDCIEGSSYVVPTSGCSNVLIYELNEVNHEVSIREVVDVPQYCLDRGYDTVVSCNNYIENYINLLDMDIDEKISLIEELEITRQEKIEIILQLEANIEEQSLIIEQFEMTIDEQRGYIQALGLTIDEQETLINSLELTITEKQELIESLETEIDNMARDIISLELSTQQQAEYIQNLSLNIEEQAVLINKLTSNLQTKAELVSQLTAENEIQAELIAQMEASFSRQGEIISNLNNTIQDDAIIIQELTQKSEEQGMIIEGMQVTIDEQRELILSLTESNEEMGRIISQLRLKTEEQRDLVEQLSKSLDEQVLIVSQMRLTLEEQRDLIEQLYNKISEQEQFIKELEEKLQQEKDKFERDNTFIYVLIGALVLSLSLIVYLRFFRKK